MVRTDKIAAGKLQLRIGGLAIGVTCGDERISQQLEARYMPWVSTSTPACRVTVRCSDGRRLPGRPSPAASFRPDRSCHVSAPGYHGVIAANGMHATLDLDAPDVADVDYFLRAVLAVLAFEREGLLLHTAGFLRRDRAILLSGRSGIGKSTSVRVSADLPATTALGDDLILLLPADSGWVAYGTPFWNPETPLALRTGQTGCGPLAGVFRLVQDQKDFVQPLSTAQFVAGLMSDLPIVPLDAARVPAIIARLARMAQSISMGQLHFRPSAGFWSVVDEFIHQPIVDESYQAAH